MGDRFTEVHETGYLQNIMASIKGVVIGIILFLASFVVLWWNEGRVDLSKVAETSIAVNADTVESAANGQFISVTGELTSDESVGDPQFLRAGPYLLLERRAEMYSWKEEKSTKTTKKVGGGKRTETTYSYSKEWSERPDNSSSFKKPEEHTNPSPSVKSQSFRVRQATVGAYRFDPQSVTFPKPSSVPITADNVVSSDDARLSGDYIFIGAGSLQNPQIGDTRISFGAVESGTTATLFGTLNGNSVEPYFYKGSKTLYRAIAGPREAAIAKMASEHRITTWILRAIGFLMMWIGLNLFFAPINVVLDVIPMLGGVSRFFVGLAMFVVALALSLVTMVVSMIAHNPFLLIGSIFVVFVAIWALGRIRPKQKLAGAHARAGGASARAPGKPGADKPGNGEALHASAQRSRPSSERISFECDECGKRYTVKASLAGRKGTCKACGNKIVIPTASID